MSGPLSFQAKQNHPQPLLAKEGKSTFASSPYEGEVGWGWLLKRHTVY